MFSFPLLGRRMSTVRTFGGDTPTVESAQDKAILECCRERREWKHIAFTLEGRGCARSSATHVRTIRSRRLIRSDSLVRLILSVLSTVSPDGVSIEPGRRADGHPAEAA
jgi:hypothetical protein